MSERELAGMMAVRVAQVSEEIHGLLHGLGQGTQGAVLADLMSLWLAGHWETDELRAGLPSGKRTHDIRAEAFAEWIKLVWDLIPESEKQMLDQIEPEGSA